ncbi:uncharacterized protein EDB93DRAFT_1075635 [Suillus bovinus]|uniref:uncharacterized protein n=1 Tax=Suillus bovinus TaxID=48563 RepID=UPI001B873190|nr:uncharacterized protein EDB93DRAFT_1075635 [Suillus bovinus]KAG2158835.1 hypothetical protein EDB93DRAFT_1075635 [Suillus bovinus]
MSSISFPHSGDEMGSSSSSLHDSMQAPFYTPPAFDMSSSFQMNPLSAHPPRTPRPSTAQSHFRNMSMSISVYDEKAEEEQDRETVKADNVEVDEDEIVELDEEDVHVKEAEKLVGAHEVWRDMFVTSKGRDKAFKLMQYSIRVYLLFHSKVLFRNGKSAWQREIVRRLSDAKWGLSFTRKMLIMFDWLAPLSQVLAQQPVPFSSSGSSLVPHSFTDTPASSSKSLQLSGGPFLSHPVLRALLSAPPPVLLELVNGLSEDIHSLSKLGLIGSKLGARAARFADWCWLFSTLVGLVENGVELGVIEGLQREVQSRAYKESLAGATSKSQPKASKIDERELTRLEKQNYWLQISRAKLVMDLIFVSWDIFRIKGWKDSVQSFTGLAAAVLSCAKLYDKYRTTLVNKALTR